MAVVEMSKISLLGLTVNKEEILKTLMKIGCCQIHTSSEMISKGYTKIEKDNSFEKNTIKEIETKLHTVERALSYIKEYDSSKKSIFETKRTVSNKEFEEIIINEKEEILNITDKIIKNNEDLSYLKSLKNTKLNFIDSISSWSSLDIPVNLISTKKTNIQLGVVPSKLDINVLIKDLSKEVEESFCQIINTDGEQNYLMIINHIDLYETVNKILKKYNFQRVYFENLSGTIKDNIMKALDEIKKIEEDIRKNESELKDFMKYIFKIEMLYDYLSLQLEQKKVDVDLINTKQTFILEGWIPSQTEESVKNIMKNNWDLSLDIQKPSINEERPILISNKGIGYLVESITKMFSLPNHKETDPNTIMAPFFILFFGLMLGDGGYGLMMSLVSAIILKKYILNEEMRRFMKLIFACGISTIFWGALFGGWFGIEAFNKYGIWFNPVKDPQEMLKWSLAFGVFHIYVGFAVRGFNLFKQKKYIDIIFDVLLWYIFLSGFVLFALPFVPNIEGSEVEHLVVLGKRLIIYGGILLVLTQGRKQKNILMKIVSGFGSLYELIGFMSDVLSYSRLLALGLATSVIASIVNQISTLYGLDNIIKILLFIVILVFGHTFNFAINALGAYVHSSRLQYIEFFGKFYKGGGRNFEPFKIITKYINITK